MYYFVYTSLLSQWEFFPNGKFGSSLLLPPRKASCNRVALTYLTQINYKVHAGPFRVSANHRALTWITGSLTCARDHSYACENTPRVGHTHPQRVTTTFLTRKKISLFFFIVLLTGFEPRVFGSRVGRSASGDPATPLSYCLHLL